MATLEIDVHCLCLFVPDPDTKTVHLLMPNTTHGNPHRQGEHQGQGEHEGHDGHGGMDVHAVRIRDATKADDPGLPMEKWALEFGKGDASADTTMCPVDEPDGEARVIDLTQLSKLRLPRELVDDTPEHDVVITRVAFRAGRLKALNSQATWDIGGNRVPLAHLATWIIDDVSEEDLAWTSPTGGKEGLLKLADLQPDGQVLRIALHHQTPGSIPAGGGLTEAQVKSHFRAFYKLFGNDRPDDAILPKDPAIGGRSAKGRVDLGCPVGQGRLR